MVLFPFLYKGLTTSCLRLLGKVPIRKDKLNIYYISFVYSFSVSERIPSGHGDFFSLRLFLTKSVEVQYLKSYNDSDFEADLGNLQQELNDLVRDFLIDKVVRNLGTHWWNIKYH